MKFAASKTLDWLSSIPLACLIPTAFIGCNRFHMFSVLFLSWRQSLLADLREFGPLFFRHQSLYSFSSVSLSLFKYCHSQTACFAPFLWLHPAYLCRFKSINPDCSHPKNRCVDVHPSVHYHPFYLCLLPSFIHRLLLCPSGQIQANFSLIV